ncbi:MAG: hypothetical protein DMF61_25655 [Blastocatellia bacterium AA13]|nr:MAG: hypothetical protein DMF61_25655 [Blastocatellia bacterium AA13]
MSKDRATTYNRGDEIAYAQPNGMAYGTVLRVIESGESGAVEIEFEDGRKEIKKIRDRGLSLVRRASGAAPANERSGERTQLRDFDVERVRRSDQRRRS